VEIGSLPDRVTKSEDSLRVSWWTISNGLTFAVFGFQKKMEKGPDILFEEIMAEHFPKWGKERYSDPGILESSK